jgi:hypothetical protein
MLSATMVSAIALSTVPIWSAKTLPRLASPVRCPDDIVINLVEVAKENWSFGHGIAQYAS